MIIETYIDDIIIQRLFYNIIYETNMVSVQIGDVIEKVGNCILKKVTLTGPGPDVNTVYGYTDKGDWVGDEKMSRFLCVKKGINPEKISPKNNICSIGYCEKDGKWYGWSHRAIFGFKKGDVVKKGNLTNTSGLSDEYLKTHPGENYKLKIGFKAKNEEDAKKMAIAFANSVS